MHVPSWLLLILISYLTKRTMALSYKGQTSSPRDLPGSSPQGAFLGIFFFIVKYNGVALRPQIPRILFNTECKFKLEKCTTEQCVKHAKDMHVIYIDDLSEAEAIDLKKQLVKDPLQRPFPLNYPERTQHVFKLRLGALIPRSVGRSVCQSVCLSVGLSVLQKLQKITKLYKTSKNIRK